VNLLPRAYYRRGRDGHGYRLVPAETADGRGLEAVTSPDGCMLSVSVESARTAVTGSSWRDSAATVTRMGAVVTLTRELGRRPDVAGDRWPGGGRRRVFALSVCRAVSWADVAIGVY
jgi:hypothetical protein